MTRTSGIVLAILVAGLAGWLVSQQRQNPVQAREPENVSGAANVATARTPAAEKDLLETRREPVPEIPGPVLPTPKPVSIAATENPPAFESDDQNNSPVSPITAMENLRLNLRQYHQRFGENPVGSNVEITAILNGQNSRQINFFSSEDHVRLSTNGELLDNWGTPYFFHQISANEMEIHSAGPDHKMWTADDLVIK